MLAVFERFIIAIRLHVLKLKSNILKLKSLFHSNENNGNNFIFLVVLHKLSKAITIIGFPIHKVIFWIANQPTGFLFKATLPLVYFQCSGGRGGVETHLKGIEPVFFNLVIHSILHSGHCVPPDVLQRAGRRALGQRPLRVH